MNKYEVFNEKTGAIIRVDWDHDPAIRPPLPDGCSLRLVEETPDAPAAPADPEPAPAPMPEPEPEPPAETEPAPQHEEI